MSKEKLQDINKRMIFRVRAFIFTVSAFIVTFVLIRPVAVQAVTPVCDSFNGSNVEAQNYTRSATPVGSYLVPLDDGRLMRVQWVSEISKVVVEYYNKDYDVLSIKQIDQELPIFGAFYEYNGSYYICSGQRNDDASPDKEVYRITKYTSEWKKIGSASLYGANTTIPFSSGSCRMTGAGKYLIVRTCHTMFSSSDGYRHQANVTIEIDTEKMTVTDSLYIVSNNTVGYVSHSFNQFVSMEGNNIVAVDHGDAYPRSIALYKYSSDASTGKFYGYNNVKTIPLLEIYGEIGNNTTNASVGGFELSDSSYLVVGNSILQDGKSRSTRNVFITSTARTNSSTDNTKLQWLTNYAEGETGASTPQIVKISGNDFMVLWSHENSIYYVNVDGKGQMKGDVMSFEGSLSDCKPVLYDSKIVWYTWENNIIRFYEISLSSKKGNVIEIINGHEFDESQVSVDSRGVASISCKRCHSITKYNVPVSLNLFFRDKETTKKSQSYWNYHADEYECGESVEILLSYNMGTIDTSLLNREDFEIVADYPFAVDISKVSDTCVKVTLKRAITTHITISSKFNPGLKKVVIIKAANEEPVISLNITKNPVNVMVETGHVSKFTVAAEGTDLKYQWQFMLAGKTTWTSWTGKTSATLSVPYDKKKNNMKVRCQVSDATGKKLNSKEAVLVYTNLFEITVQPVNVTVESGHAAPFSVAVAGNGLTYQWQFKLASASGWKNWDGKTASLLKVPYDIKKNGMLVRCVITNDKGAKLTSGEAKLVYNGAAPSINRQPASINVASGHAGVFSIGVSGDTLSFQWQYKLAGATTWKNWSGKTESTLKVAYDAKKNGMSVRCVVTDKNGKKVTSAAAVMKYVD